MTELTSQPGLWRETRCQGLTSASGLRTLGR